MDSLDGSVWHQQSVFEIKILSVFGGLLDCLPHECHVFRMNSFEYSIYRGLD